jgi:hypothetical protein
LEATTDSPFRADREIWRMMTGLARFRRDGFAYLTLPKPRQLPQPRHHKTVPKYQLSVRGFLRTIPFEAKGIAKRALHLNVENYAPGFANLRVQLRAAESGEILSGYTFADCEPVDQPSLDHVVKWGGSQSLEGIAVNAIQIEIQFHGALNSPQLYSLWFAADG